ncbi:hypothetical protein BDB00DRAFT_829483 [Zychaea mexicana]|uniref:uncharacterized protein n=1 Tax=Zychaea mexicana TaxID=64656 RepID=UPI0022FEC55F|nr:uncharacterized protein BDB00DRAFT_829483 [Zychaea mexicana]KAI9492174.1 hypothetical protein BDB00DRAFT_829483 [Zychaea mexicana]
MPLDKRNFVKTLNHHMNQLAWAMCRDRPEEATNKLFHKVQEWQGKLGKPQSKPAVSDKAPSESNTSTDANTTPETNSAKPKRQARLVQRELAMYDPLNVTDDDNEEEEEQEGDEEQEGSPGVTEREPSNRRIRALTSIIKKIFDTTKKQASTKIIKETAFKGTVLTDKQCSAAAKIANALRPYYCPEDQDDEQGPAPVTVHQAAPLAYITNAIVDIIVPQQHVLAVAPEVHPNDHAIHLSASALYTLVSEKYEMPCRATGKTVTSKRQAGIGEARRDVIGAFFSLSKIYKALQTRDLVFAYRLTFVNRHTVRVLGVSGHEGSDSDHAHDTEKAPQGGPSNKMDMDLIEGSENESKPGSVLSDIFVDDKATGKGKQPMAPTKTKGKGKQAMARTNPKGKGKAGTGKSRKAHNKSRRKKRKAKSSPSDRPSKKRNKNKDSSPTKKDTDVDDEKEGIKAQRIKEFETCARRLAAEVAKLQKQGNAVENERADLANAFRREWKMTKLRNREKYGELQMVRKQANSVIAQVAQKQRQLADIRSQLYLMQQKPKAEPAALDKEQQLLQEKIVESLATNKNVGVIGVDPGLVVSATSITTTAKDLYQTIVPYTRPQPSSSPSSSSAPETAPVQPSDLPSVARPLPPAQTYTTRKKTAATLEAAHQARREQYKKKHGYNTGDQDRRQKEARTRDIRHDVFHRKLASSWRVRGSASTLTFFGAYKSTNSRIKDHCRGANATLQQHLGSPDRDHVTVTNEHRSSKTCPFCHSPTKLHQYRREGKLVKVNGALRMPNKSRNTHNRDQVGSVNIASIGFSKAISATNTPIPPFSRMPFLSYTISPYMEQLLT